MKTATFILFVSFIFFAMLGMVYSLPEPIKAGSITARSDGTTPALEGLGALVARGDDGKGHDYCWDDKYGNEKCGKYCCKKYETCCGDSKCCQKGYKCYKKDKDYDDKYHKRGDDDYSHGYEWYCKEDDYEHNW